MPYRLRLSFRSLAPVALTMLTASIVAPATADAEPAATAHAPGVTVGTFVLHGVNTDDDAADFDRGQYVGGQLGYRFTNGLEPYLVAAASPNLGHENFAVLYGVGLRGRLRLGPVEPFAEVGAVSVGDGAPPMWSLSYGAGVEVPITGKLAIGVAAGGYLNDDSDERGGLDWSARAQLTYRFGD